MCLRIISLLIIFLNLISTAQLWACESCSISQIGRDKQGIKSESEHQKWFHEFNKEVQR